MAIIDAAPSGQPMVSVIVPTYNRPDMLLEAVRSILGQSLQEFEVIVVNDGGVDVAADLRRLDAPGRIRYLEHPANAGLPAARNTGLRAATGRYVAYLDDDDLYYPDHLETLVGALEASRFQVAYSDALSAIHLSTPGEDVTTRRVLEYSRDFDRDTLLVQNLFPVLCVMHRRECLDVVGMFDESLSRCEDWEFWIRLSRHYDFLHIARVTAEYSSKDDGTSMRGGDLRRFLDAHRSIYARHAASATPRIRRAQSQAYQQLLRRIEEHQLHREAHERAASAQALRRSCEAMAAAGRSADVSAVLARMREEARADADARIGTADFIASLDDPAGAAAIFEGLLTDPYRLRLEVQRLEVATADAQRIARDQRQQFLAWRDAAAGALQVLRLTGTRSPWFIWGSGAAGRRVLEAMSALGARPEGFLDSAATADSAPVGGVPVVGPGILRAMVESGARPGVVVASMAHREIARSLDALGWQAGSDYVIASPAVWGFLEGVHRPTWPLGDETDGAGPPGGVVAP